MLTRYKGRTALKSWGQKIAKRRHKKAGGGRMSAASNCRLIGRWRIVEADLS